MFTVKRVVIPELEEKVMPRGVRNGYTQEEDRIILSYYNRVPAREIATYLKKMGHQRSIDSIRGRYKNLVDSGVKVVDEKQA